jgi:hypothetical protein
MMLDLPFMLYQGRRYAFKKVQRMDPSSTQRGVRQFKTYMSIKLDQVSFLLELFMMLFPLPFTVPKILICYFRKKS